MTVQTTANSAIGGCHPLDSEQTVAPRHRAESTAKTVLQITNPNAKLWAPITALYRCRAMFDDDCAETTFGVRTR